MPRLFTGIEIPPDMGERLSRAFPHATLQPIPGGHHNDLLWSHAAELRSAIGPFLEHGGAGLPGR